MRNYCTYFDIKYIRQGLALHESMERHCQPYHLWILALCDDTWKLLTRHLLPNVTVVNLNAIETAKLEAARPTRTWQEYIWTLTGTWMVWVMRRNELDHINYMDADCYFFSDPQPVFDEIGDAPLGITPHRFPPHRKHFEVNGLFNVGLVYANRQGLPCLEEWAAQTIEWCYNRSEDGKYADQKYLDEWPEKWGAHSIQHLGANLAPWNQEQYEYTIQDRLLWVNTHPAMEYEPPQLLGRLTWSHYPLIWYHFHQGFDPKWPIHPTLMEWAYPRYREAWKRYDNLILDV